MPHILGVEGVGIIEKTSVKEFVVGQKVAFLGTIGAATYSEYVAIDANKLIALSDNTDLEKAAVIPISYLTAYILLKKKINVSSGDTVMIYAASGGVGTTLVQLSKLFGLQIIALERHESKLEFSVTQGVDLALSTNYEDWKSKIMAFTNNKGVNHICNSVAGNTLKDDLELLAVHGNIVVYGMLGGVGDINLLAESFSNFAKSPSIHFSELYSYFNQPEFIKSTLQTLYELLNKEQIAPVYSIFKMEEAAKVHELLETGKIQGKALLSFN